MLRAVSLLLLIGLVIVGCQPNTQAFRPPRKKAYNSVISLSPGATEVLLSLGDYTTLKGRTAADNWPKGTVNNIPVVASVKPDYEKIRAIKPNLIVYDASLFSDQDVAKMRETGADMFAIQANTVNGLIKQYYELASVTASEKNMNDYINRIIAEREAAKGTPIEPKPKVAVLMPGEGSADYIVGTKSFLADAIATAGGQPVGPEADRFVQASPEAIVALNPDLIIIPGSKENVKGAEAVASNPKYKTVKAIQDKKVKVIDQDVLLRRGGRVDILLRAIRNCMTG